MLVIFIHVQIAWRTLFENNYQNVGFMKEKKHDKRTIWDITTKFADTRNELFMKDLYFIKLVFSWRHFLDPRMTLQVFAHRVSQDNEQHSGSLTSLYYVRSFRHKLHHSDVHTCDTRRLSCNDETEECELRKSY